jgi:urease accessory protein
MNEDTKPVAARRVLAPETDAPAPCDRARLPFDSRWLRRAVIETETGMAVLVDLPEARVLSDGDRLALEDGRVVKIEAAPEALAEIRAEDPLKLARLAWHLGNRHLPTRIEADRLLIRRDHVIEEMVALLGGRVRHVEAAFEPEGGAYGHGHVHGHDHGHVHGHDHGHGHNHGHGHG